jgi:hypothetical protein
MDVATEAVRFAERPRDGDELLHRVVGTLEDTRAEKQPLDVIATIEVEREAHDLLDGEARALDVARDPARAIAAIVDAEVREEDLEKRHASAIRRVAMADAHPLGAAEAALLRAPLRTAARTRSVVLRGVGQDRKLASQLHGGSRILGRFR